MSLKEIEAKVAKQEAQLKRGEELLKGMREIQEISENMKSYWQNLNAHSQGV